jgi:cellulose 1,4-beta-cellobiosidase
MIRSSRRFKRRHIAAISAAALVAGGVAAVTMVPANAATSGCTVQYVVQSQWGGGFTGSVTITNLGAATTSWTLGFDFPASGQGIQQGWSANWTTSGQHVTATSMTWNGALGTNASTNIGFNGTWTSSNPVPTTFTLNGQTCNGPINTSSSASVSPSASRSSASPSTSVSPTASRSVSASPSRTQSLSPTASISTSVPPPSGEHVDNPYSGAVGFINPDWRDEVTAAGAAKGGTLGSQMTKVANTPTAVWLDRIAAVTGGTGVTHTMDWYMDQALAQQNSSGKQVVAEFVVYDLPNRDCSALASNGELLIAQDGLNKYKTLYIDPIYNIISNSKYSKLRLSLIIEPDSLPNLLTNLSFAKCAEANSTGAYIQGVQYAINKLGALSNVYTYVDAAHSGWLGWDSNFGPFVNQLASLAGGLTKGYKGIDGIVSNTANSTPTIEPYMTANTQVGGQPVRSANFYKWNQYIDEQSYVLALRSALIAKGFPSTLGAAIDTSRNGWGGAARPNGPSSSTDLNTFVNATRIDRRPHRGDWCNQSGAGLGFRPVASPAAGLDAYVWIKPPGESDGASKAIPNDQGKGADPMCDPAYPGNSLNENSPTGALPDAPLSGAWFEAQFEQLVQNAYPAVS